MHAANDCLIIYIAARTAKKCLNEGRTVTYQCQVPAVVGVLDWNGVGFDCPTDSTISNNTLPLQTSACPLLDQPVYNAVCGPYSGNLTCAEDQEHLISVLEFKSNYSMMNGGNISCLLNTDRVEIFSVRIGGKLFFDLF